MASYLGGGGRKSLVEVADDVLDTLDSYGQAYQAGVGAGGRLLFLAQLAVGCGCGVDDEASSIANIGHVAVQLQPFYEFPPGFETAFDLERGNRAEPLSFGELLRPLVPLTRCQAREMYPLYLRMFLEVLSHSKGVGAVPFPFAG